MAELARDNGPLPQDVAVTMMPIIRRIARRLAKRLPPHVCIEDLESAGMVGLVTAYRRFDPALGDDFHAYAELRIRGAMIDELRASDPLSRDLRSHTNRTAAATRALEARFGRAPAEDEIASELGLPLEIYRAHASRAAVGATVSLDADGDSPMQLGDRSAMPADEVLFRTQALEVVRDALTALPPRLRKIVEQYYGEERTLRDIGKMLGVTESRICQLQGEAIQRLRAYCMERDPAAAVEITAALARRGRRGRVAVAA